LINQIYASVPICASAHSSTSSSSPSSAPAASGEIHDEHGGGGGGGGGGLEAIATSQSVSGSRPGCLLRFNDLSAALQQPSAGALETYNLWKNWRLVAGANLTANYARLAELTNKGMM
jgi:hypothetical protein